MRDLWQGLRSHPATTAMLLAAWLATWIVTIVTWKRDAAGHSVGMAPAGIALHFALPLLVGAVVALVGGSASALRLRTCALAGLGFGLVEFGVLAVVDLFWLPSVEAPPPVLEQVAGAAVGAVLYAAICVVLSIGGGALSAAVAARPQSGPGGQGRR